SKHGGPWQLTVEGKAVMSLPAEQILDKAIQPCRKWKAAPPIVAKDGSEGATPIAEVSEQDVAQADRSFVLESAEGQALAEIQEYVNALSPYEFQEAAAALLRGMGYATPFEAARGPDGGTDILAYPDPIGANTPH